MRKNNGKMNRALALISGFLKLICAGCATELVVTRLCDEPLDVNDKQVIFINQTQWNIQLAKDSSVYGFRIKKFPTSKTVVEGASQRRIEIYKEAEARYGLALYPGSIINYCVFNPGVLFDQFALEVSDLETGNIMLLIECPGWTQDCYTGKNILFPKLAKALKDNWK